MTAAVFPGGLEPGGGSRRPWLRRGNEPGAGLSLGLALAMHGLLVLGLWLSVHWQVRTPAVVEAELWSALPQRAALPAAAPAETPVEAPVQPPAPPPPPRTQTPPRPEPAPPPVPEVRKRDADIALEREKAAKAKAEADRLERERADRLRREQAEKAEKARLERDKAERERAERERLDKQKQDKAREKEKAEKAERAEREKAERDKAERAKAEARRKSEAEQKVLEAQRQRDLDRMMGQARAGGAAAGDSSGTAAANSGPRSLSSNYAGLIMAKIRSNTTWNSPTPVSGNPQVVYSVELLPSGEILSLRKKKTSGIAAFDDAVERGIRRSEPFPRDRDGSVPRSIEVVFNWKDIE